MVKKKSKVTVICQMTVTLLLASCAPLETIPSTTTTPVDRTLAPPHFGRVANPTDARSRNVIPTYTMPPVIPAYTTTPPAQVPIPKSDIARMADELFGARQIQSISIPVLNIESEVVPVGWRVNFTDDLQSGGFEWDSPEANVGWIITSALPDETGNIILYGHNNTYAKVFLQLSEVVEGDKVYLQTKDRLWEYEVRYILILPIFGVSAAQIKSYQQYLKSTADARVTIISCWPSISNTHRVVVIAKPVEK